MDRDTPPDWYLDIEGTRSGPYTTEQIEGFFRDREILPRHRVISVKRPDQSILVSDFVAALEHHRSQLSAAQPPAFQPPPRPSDMDERTGLIQVPVRDPSEALFDALQGVRERKMNSKMATPDLRDWGNTRHEVPRIPPQTLLIGALAAVLCVSVWGVMKISGKPDMETASRQGSRPAASVAAAQPAPATPAQPDARPRATTHSPASAVPKHANSSAQVRPRPNPPAIVRAPMPRVAVPVRSTSSESAVPPRAQGASPTGGATRDDREPIDGGSRDDREDDRDRSNDDRDRDREGDAGRGDEKRGENAQTDPNAPPPGTPTHPSSNEPGSSGRDGQPEPIDPNSLPPID